ncbi:hypothetical protein CHLNCDRAFT_142658, partial [Chlorella variabilis]
ASRGVLRRLRAADQAKRETAKARNDLESYVIGTRDKVEGGEEVAGVSTEAQREAFLAQLAEVEDWLYGDGEAVGAEEYRAQLRKLRLVGDRLFERAAEAAARPRVLRLAGDFVDLARKAANSWPDIKPWLNASDIAALVAKVVGSTLPTLPTPHAAHVAHAARAAHAAGRACPLPWTTSAPG